jgi:hypothetical protein
MLSPIWRSTVSSGSVHVTGSLKNSKNKFDNIKERQGTNAGNSPLHLATYSLRIVPVINSSVRVLAHSGDKAITIMPEVNRSSLLTA